MTRPPEQSTGKMSAIRLVSPRGLEGLALEEVEIPRAGPGEVLVRVHAAAITRAELEWPVDRLPAIPSYKLSGDVALPRAGAEDPAASPLADGSPPATGARRPRRFRQGERRPP